MDPIKIVDGVALLRLAGGRANAMSTEFLGALDGLLDELEHSDARAAVITGYDRFFSAGLALPTLIGLDRAQMKRFIELFDAVMTRVFRCPLPVVAAVNGHAIAGGCVLALQADWRIMVSDPGARIGLNEAQLGIGLPAIAAESLRLQVPSRSWPAIAFEGRLVSPEEALALGLVDELVAASDLEPRAMARAKALAAVPSGGVAQIKGALRRSVLETVERREAEEVERWLDTWFSPPARALLSSAVARLERSR